MVMRKHLLGYLLFSVMCSLALAQSGTHFAIKFDNATTPGAIKINDAGQVAMTCSTSDGLKRATRYDNGSFLDLGPTSGRSYAFDINASGQVVGNIGTIYWDTYPTDDFYYGYSFVTDSLGNRITLNTGSYAPISINESGIILGKQHFQLASYYDTNLNNGTINNIDLSPSFWTYPYDINDNNFAVLSKVYSTGRYFYLYDLNTSTQTILPISSTSRDAARAINNSNTICGFSSTTSGIRAFRYTSGAITNLSGSVSTNSTYGQDINDDGYIAGYQTPSGGSTKTAVYWNPSSTVAIPLSTAVSNNTLLTSFDQATSINNENDIVGFGTSTSGSTVGFLALNKTRKSYTQVPAADGTHPYIGGTYVSGNGTTTVESDDNAYFNVTNENIDFVHQSSAKVKFFSFGIPASSVSGNGVNSITIKAIAKVIKSYPFIVNGSSMDFSVYLNNQVSSTTGYPTLTSASMEAYNDYECLITLTVNSNLKEYIDKGQIDFWVSATANAVSYKDSNNFTQYSYPSFQLCIDKAWCEINN